MDEETIEKIGLDPITNLINTFGGYPMMIGDEWIEENFDLTYLISKTRFYAKDYLFNLIVNIDDKNSNNHITYIDQGNLGLQREQFLNGKSDKLLTEYKNMIYKVALLLNNNQTIVKKDLDDMIDFEIKLANITVSEDERRDDTRMYNLFTLEDLSRNLSNIIDWKLIIKNAFSTVNISIDNNEKIILACQPYFQKLGTLINNTSKRIMVNLLITKIVMNLIPYLPISINNIVNQFNKVITGIEQVKPRWITCLSMANKFLPSHMGRIYIDKFFKQQAKEKAHLMIKELKLAFIELLNDVNWMSKTTKNLARDKLMYIREGIGYSDFILNDTFLESDFKEIVINEKDLFNNVISLNNWSLRSMYSLLRQNTPKENYVVQPAVINAFYNPNRNSMTFPAGILQPPFYDEYMPMYLNFGGIGMVIGHEITHGFDDRGRKFDKDGNLIEWWIQDDIDKFIAQKQCFINQYSNYSIPGIIEKTNGRLTQGENIADNGGLKQAFLGYQNWVKKYGKEPSLPGLIYSSEQLFFLTFAQGWCSSYRPEYLKQTILGSKHSLGIFRVLGSLQNFDEFSKSYNCPLDSKMNPRKKCQVW